MKITLIDPVTNEEMDGKTSDTMAQYTENYAVVPSDYIKCFVPKDTRFYKAMKQRSVREAKFPFEMRVGKNTYFIKIDGIVSQTENDEGSFVEMIIDIIDSLTYLRMVEEAKLG